MRTRRLVSIAFLTACVGFFFSASLVDAKPKGKGSSHQPQAAQHVGHPHGMPPGLAKKFGPAPSTRVFIALDPRRDDLAWFLIDDRWVLRSLPEASVRREIRALLLSPPAPHLPPPIPLPRPGIDLRLVIFG